jgi:Ca-activated chloride channel family protein
MIVFDASGSMAGDGWGYGSESAGTVSRIDKVRSVLREILRSITRFRRVGLLSYGSGAWNQCTIQLGLRPSPNAANSGRRSPPPSSRRPMRSTPATSLVSS